MQRTAALLAALIAFAATGCGGGEGAEPGAPAGAARALTLVLDFQPNAVHAPIYLAEDRGYFSREGIELEIREPGASTDGPKLLRAGRADLAILDIHDLALAREQGADLVAVGAVVQVPLAAVIAADRTELETPADLDGARVGVTGLPSDQAVLGAILDGAGLDEEDVDTVTIGFNSVAALSAGRVDAATAFWNAEGVELKRLGVATREFRVGGFGVPRYPELVFVTTRAKLADRRAEIAAALAAIRRATELVGDDPGQGLEALLRSVPDLARSSQASQLEALIEAEAFEPAVELQSGPLNAWASFESEHGVVAEPVDIQAATAPRLARGYTGGSR